MATLTTSEKTRIRNTIGDVLPSGQKLSDTRLQDIHDEFGADIDLTMLHCAYELAGHFMRLTDLTAGPGVPGERRSQPYDRLVKDVIPRLERISGKLPGKITTATYDRNIRTDIDDITD